MHQRATTSTPLLAHFDPKVALILACDASGFVMGDVLAHRKPDSSKRPIGYASRSPFKPDRNYSQLEKESLSCVLGVKYSTPSLRAITSYSTQTTNPY